MEHEVVVALYSSFVLASGDGVTREERIEFLYNLVLEGCEWFGECSVLGSVEGYILFCNIRTSHVSVEEIFHEGDTRGDDTRSEATIALDARRSVARDRVLDAHEEEDVGVDDFVVLWVESRIDREEVCLVSDSEPIPIGIYELHDSSVGDAFEEILSRLCETREILGIERACGDIRRRPRDSRNPWCYRSRWSGGSGGSTSCTRGGS